MNLTGRRIRIFRWRIDIITNWPGNYKPLKRTIMSRESHRGLSQVFEVRQFTFSRFHISVWKE